jgi:cytochrome c biogenesis protein CcmG/thiol:disulfide interchange protein DsbE
MKVLLSIMVLTSLTFLAGCENKQGVKIGDTSPEISGKDIQGKDISLSKLKGKVVILYFWKNSCCGDSLKKLEPFQSESKDKGLAVMAVNVGDSQDIVESYVKDYALTFTMLTDENSKLFKQYHVIGFPTIFILDKNGIVREKIMGDIQTEKLAKLVVKQFTIKKRIEANYEKTHPR